MSGKKTGKSISLDNIAGRMRHLRRNFGYTQDEFARVLGISKPSYVRYELGKRTPSLPLLQRLHEKYDIDINWLAVGEGKMFASKAAEESDRILSFQDIAQSDHRYRNYVELTELMQIPAIEQVIMARLIEVRQLFRKEVEQFLTMERAKRKNKEKN